MRNYEFWSPSKYILGPQGWSASRDSNELHNGSRFIAALQIEKYASIIKVHAHGVLCDVGCGKVPLYGVYKDQVKQTFCIDWQVNNYIDIVGDLNRNLPLQDAIFDTVICSDVLEHIYHPSNLMVEITRTLKPGGRLLLFVPFYYILHEIPHDYFRYSEFALRKFAEENNLKILYLEANGGLPEIIFDMLAKLLNFSGLLTSINYYLCTFLVHTRFVKYLSAHSMQRYPVGYSLVAEKAII